MQTMLDQLTRINAELDGAELGLSEALKTIQRVSSMIEAIDAGLRQPSDKRWLLFPLDIEWPVSGEFGVMYEIGGLRWQHEGIDFACPTGCGIRACASGVVDFAGLKGGYGNFVRLSHTHNGATWRTGYAHLSTIDCHIGQTLIAKQFVGLTGASGNVTGAHLHLTVWSPDSNYRPQGCTEYLRGVVNPRDWVMWP